MMKEDPKSRGGAGPSARAKKAAKAGKGRSHGRIVAAPDGGDCLDAVQLDLLEQSFRAWARDSRRLDVRLSRRRILLIFLLIRYTGAKLNEVLALDPFSDIDHERHSVAFRNADDESEAPSRRVQLPSALSDEIRSMLAEPDFRDSLGNLLKVDPAFVRRKFYERATACGFDKQLGGPEMVRRARAVELMQGNMPLPAVQMMLGHSTPNLTSSLVSFSEEEIRKVTKLHMERESARKTSARNSFYGKIGHIRRGDVQASVRLVTVGGHEVTTVITTDSLGRLGWKEGSLITAEVKAPWVTLYKGEEEPRCSAENRFAGEVVQLNRGKVNAECVVRIADGTLLCAIVSAESCRLLNLAAGDRVWVTFNCFSVVLHAE